MEDILGHEGKLWKQVERSVKAGFTSRPGGLTRSIASSVIEVRDSRKTKTPSAPTPACPHTYHGSVAQDKNQAHGGHLGRATCGRMAASVKFRVWAPSYVFIFDAVCEHGAGKPPDPGPPSPALANPAWHKWVSEHSDKGPVHLHRQERTGPETLPDS